MDILIITLQVLSLITTIIGLYLLGEKNKYGFLVFTISLIIQFYIFLIQDLIFLCLQMIVLILFNTWNFYKWHKEGK
jgi:hypothetical protein